MKFVHLLIQNFNGKMSMWFFCILLLFFVKAFGIRSLSFTLSLSLILLWLTATTPPFLFQKCVPLASEVLWVKLKWSRMPKGWFIAQTMEEETIRELKAVTSVVEVMAYIVVYASSPPVTQQEVHLNFFIQTPTLPLP